MKYCEDFAALLDPFVDGELTPDEMARVQAHLDECPACRAYVDDALAIRAAFPDVEDAELPDGFAESVMARIQAEAAQKQTSRPWLKALASLAACCAIVLLAAPMFSGDAKTEAAPAAAAAAAPAERAMGFALTEEAPAAETAEEPREDLAASKVYDAAPAPSTAADSGATVYCIEAVAASTLTLPLEAASLLADFAPVEETDTAIRYELSRQDCDALTGSLSQAGIDYDLEDTGSDTVLVVLQK